ncbi:MAG: hypothetical protein GY790_16160 [Bacteroidetes bacterium]|nr:hypothetical protein [Bacteroidota bacterium]
MGKLISILLLIMPAGMSGDYPLRNGKPTSEGVEQYVEENSDSLVQEFQEFVGDTLYNIWFYSDDFEDQGMGEPIELGRHFPHEIYVSTAELFEAYELGDLSRAHQEAFRESNKFVKAVMIHELTHEYFNQIGVEMKSVHHIHVDKCYETGVWMVKSHETFGSSFIEEGLCEYVTGKMGELIPPRQVEIPSTVEELLDRESEYMVKYKYASIFLETFLDTTGFKEGVQILMHNPPPTYEEILHPDHFFGRLVVPEFSEAISAGPTYL